MGLTILDLENRPKAELLGGLKTRIVSITFDASYPTGGEALTAANLGLSTVLLALIAPAAGFVLEYDYTNSKVLAYYADYDAVADGALIQVPNTTNLATLVTRAFVIGT